MALSRLASNLSPLYEKCLFKSDERIDSHEQVSNEFADHQLKWGRGAVNAAMFKARLDRLHMYVLRYGAEVAITPRPFEHFALVHMSMRGGAEIESDGHRLSVAEGRAAVIAPRRDIKLRWMAGTEQLILKVPEELFDEVRTSLPDDPLATSSGFLMPRLLTPQWGLLMQTLLSALSAPAEAGLSKAWISHFEHNVALFLLDHQAQATGERSASDWPGPASDDELGGPIGLAEGERRMNALMQFMKAKLSAPISLADLARAAGTSERSLNPLCRRFHGMTPMELLRNLRLDAVRSRLLLQPDANITLTALDYGFGHAGRFAAYYEERFKELPHQTLIRQRG